MCKRTQKYMNVNLPSVQCHQHSTCYEKNDMCYTYFTLLHAQDFSFQLLTYIVNNIFSDNDHYPGWSFLGVTQLKMCPWLVWKKFIVQEPDCHMCRVKEKLKKEKLIEDINQTTSTGTVEIKEISKTWWTQDQETL